MSDNPYDQFDTAVANPYDQFDSAPQSKPKVLKKAADQTFLQRAEQGMSENFNKPLLGLAEGVGNFVSAPVGAAIGGLHGLYGLATGDNIDQAAQKVQDTSSMFTYQPKTAHGEVVTDTINKPFELANQALGTAGEAVGGNVGRTVGEAALPVAMTVAGGRGAMKSPIAKNSMPVSEVPKVFKRALSEEPTPAQVNASRAKADLLDAGHLANKYGIAIDPAAVNPTVKNKLTSGLVGGTRMSRVLSEKNSPVIVNALKNDVGIAPETRLSLDAIDKVRQEAALPSEKIAVMGTMLPDAETVSTIRQLVPDQLIGGRAAQANASTLVNEAVAHVKNGAPADLMLKNISQLRKEARDIYNRNDVGRAELAVADTNIGIANALEGMIEKNLAKTGKTQLLNDFRNSRVRMAKSYALEDIYDANTGHIDTGKLARLTQKDNAFTGAFSDIGKIAGNFPDAVKPMLSADPYATHLYRSGVPGTVGAAIGTFAAPGLGTAMGGAAGAAVGELAGRYGANMIARKGYQAKHSAPQDFRPLRERQGYTAEVLRGRPTPDQLGTSMIPYEAPPLEGEVIPRNQVPNWTIPERGPDIGPPGQQPPQLPQFTYEQQIERLRNPEWAGKAQWEREKAAAAEAQQSAAESAGRMPAKGGVQFDIDPITGKLVVSDSAVVGETPQIITDPTLYKGLFHRTAGQKVTGDRLVNELRKRRK